MEKEKQEKFKVFWDEENGIIRNEAWGDFEEEDARAQAQAIYNLLELRPGKQLALNDLRKSGTASSGARKIYVKLIRDERLRKTAFVGMKILTRTIVSFISKFAGISNVAYFDNETEAIKWLKEPDN